MSVDLIVIAMSGLCALTIAGFTWRALMLRPELSSGDAIDLPAGIGVHQIGIIERDLAYLEAVTVIADKVERPTEMLSQAVEHNFRRGVKYHFLVSGTRRPEEVKGFYGYFKAMAEMELSRSQDTTKELNDLIEIKQLPYAWDDYPLIFYRVRLPNGRPKTLAFRGDQLHEGIADHYGRVEPTLAHTIARAVVSDGPREVPDLAVDREDFEVTKGVLRLVRPRAAEAR